MYTAIGLYSIPHCYVHCYIIYICDSCALEITEKHSIKGMDFPVTCFYSLESRTFELRDSHSKMIQKTFEYILGSHYLSRR